MWRTRDLPSAHLDLRPHGELLGEPIRRPHCVVGWLQAVAHQPLRFDSDRGASGNHTRNLLDLSICNGNASICPIDKGVQPTNEPQPILHSVNHDESARFGTR